MIFAVEVHRVTSAFPRHELYGLSQQLRRAVVSVPSNIAEGKGHRSDREFGHFLLHARGSLLEVQTQVMIAQELQYVESEDAKQFSIGGRNRPKFEQPNQLDKCEGSLKRKAND